MALDQKDTTTKELNTQSPETSDKVNIREIIKENTVTMVVAIAIAVIIRIFIAEPRYI